VTVEIILISMMCEPPAAGEAEVDRPRPAFGLGLMLTSATRGVVVACSETGLVSVLVERFAPIVKQGPGVGVFDAVPERLDDFADNPSSCSGWSA